MKILKSFNHRNYSILQFILKIWILTSFISSFLFVLSNNYILNKTLDFQETIFNRLFWQVYMMVLSFSLILSIPAILILLLIIKLWSKNKFFIITSAIVLVNITFYFTGSMIPKNTKMDIPLPPLIYSLVISGLILITTIKGQDERLN